MLSWEKPLVKPMAPGSTFHHISFRPILFCNLYFPIYIIKIPKIIILLSLSDLTFASGREGIDNPFIALVARFLFVCVGTRRLACSLLLDWYLGSQKLREILTLTTREKPSSSAGFRPISSVGRSATGTTLQLKVSRSVGWPTLLLHQLSSSAFSKVRYW